MAKNTLSVTDNRTGKTYELPIENDTIKATDLRQIRVKDEDFGMMSYDPAFGNTASCKSRVTFIDGEKGILRYRGYPIEELAKKSNFLEVAYLLIHGELPNKSEYDSWVHDITHHTYVHENIRKLMDGFRYDAHPMGMLLATVGALSTFYPDAKDIFDTDVQKIEMRRLIAKTPTIAGFSYRHIMGLPYVYPDNELSYAGNFLSMMFKMTEAKYEPNPAIEKAIDVLFILHADHEQNCSASAMRNVASSHPDPYSAAAAAIAALYGPLHGGANEAVLEMLADIGSIDKIPQYIERAKKGEFRLMGFGHRVYKAYDPRAAIIKDIAHDVFEVTGKNPLLDIALELERIALEDDYFVRRRLYPNVDFYSGLIYQSIGLPTSMFTVLFAIARMAGWLAQWLELLNDPETRIARPRQVYLGEDNRKYVAMSRRRKKK
ncbi:MAG: citrate synthase [Candidatus Dadabacteria bacterium]|nr:citrate synthase [Candidatus Dadabacteria bacterium]MYA48286.1 citrate synthase [Candidatus Dadabacteria bacterium]MYC39873.1 citrate synthase [Candidatus Dadabacteria bacterium]MYF48351.1 citrate synthase [Candidatus Dadabacteria bacterium]MYG83031.1 citrate synthase [Candidatus Dadabacteria bacterium]